MYDREREIQAYEDARRMMREYIIQRTDIVACWEYGHMANPGVSDLDLIAVVSDKPGPDISNSLSSSCLPKAVASAMAHANLIVVNERSRNGLFYWDNICVRDILRGDVEYWSHTPVDEKMRLLAMVVDWTFERIYRIAAYHLCGTKDTRKTLGDLKSFTFCVENFVAVGGGRVPEYGDLRDRLVRLREHWPVMDPAAQEQAVESLVADFYSFLPNFYERLFTFFEEHSYYGAINIPNANEIWLSFPGGMRWVFVDRLRSHWLSQDGIPYVQVPRCLLGHFAAYCRSNRPLNRLFSQAFNVDPCEMVATTGDPYESFLESRMAFCNDWYDFLVANSFGYGLYKFGWFLPSADKRGFVTWGRK